MREGPSPSPQRGGVQLWSNATTCRVFRSTPGSEWWKNWIELETIAGNNTTTCQDEETFRIRPFLLTRKEDNYISCSCIEFPLLRPICYTYYSLYVRILKELFYSKYTTLSITPLLYFTSPPINFTNTPDIIWSIQCNHEPALDGTKEKKHFHSPPQKKQLKLILL